MYSLDVTQTIYTMGVWNQWNGMVEWNAGMEYWNIDLLASKYSILVPAYQRRFIICLRWAINRI